MFTLLEDLLHLLRLFLRVFSSVLHCGQFILHLTIWCAYVISLNYGSSLNSETSEDPHSQPDKVCMFGLQQKSGEFSH